MGNDIFETVRNDRKYFHAHPELSGKEELTAAYIAKRLREIGLEPTEHVGGFGVTAVIQGTAEDEGKDRCLGLRADFDALPVTEATGVDFASQNPGVMHACGHDMHAAILLGAAEVLYRMRDRFSGKVKLLFQPSEENSGDSGAKKMIADGCLENPHVDAVIGAHVWPNLEVGQVALKKGAMMANSDRFYITVHGKAAHASAPDCGIDAIVAAAHIVTDLQSIVARNVSPFDTAVVSTTMINGGVKYNIIAAQVELTGNTRSLNDKTRALLETRIGEIAESVAEANQCTASYQYCKGVDATMNDGVLAEQVIETLKARFGENVIIPEKSGMTGEDFSHFAKARPSVYYWIGVKDPQKYPDGMPALHSADFLADERALTVGVDAMTEIALAYLNA